MIVKGKISNCIQVTLLALMMLYLVTAMLRVQAEDKFKVYLKNQAKSSALANPNKVQKLVFAEAATFNASDFGIVSEKISFILPILLFLILHFFFPVINNLNLPAPPLACRKLYLYQVLPNAP